MSDQQITCSECGGSFVFTESERLFFDTKRLTPPKRCKTCRLARKAAGGEGGGRGPDRGAPFRGSREGAREHGGPRRGPGGGPGAPRGPEPAWGRMSGDAARGPRFSGPRGPSQGGQGGPREGSSARGRFGENRPPVPRAPRDGFHAPREGFHPPRAALPDAPPAPKAKKPRPAFDVTCIQCGTAAQVPFKPIEGRDVFCQPCYRARRGTPAAVATEPALEPVGVESPEPTEQGPSG